MPTPGDLSSSSIFEDERRAQAEVDAEVAAEKKSKATGFEDRDPRNMQAVLDPNPVARKRWERKKVIQMVRKGGRLSHAQFIKRTEREHMVRSHNLKTSVKKLGMLARQIAGKSIDDAIVQMRFSKKKIAGEVRKQLEFARDEATVMRGMGLGKVKAADEVSTTTESTAESATTNASPQPTSTPTVDIQLKSGKRHKVTDPSEIYIDQAWVGRGPYGRLADYRAKGRTNVMRTPWTSISLVLKEEVTRVREYQEREMKRTKQRLEKVWTALPNRPITMRQQWYSW